MIHNHTRERRICTVCGRSYGWRKKWERDWRQLRYCSKRCSRRRLGRTDYRLEEAMLLVLNRAGRGVLVAPREAAKFVDKVGWQSLADAALDAARRLSSRGEVELVEAGRVVDCDSAKRSVMVRLPRVEVRDRALAS